MAWPQVARSITLLLTWLTKLIGLAAAFVQLLLRDNPKPFALAVSAFMMAGAQFSEGVLLMIFDRLMPPSIPPPPPPKELE